MLAGEQKLVLKKKYIHAVVIIDSATVLYALRHFIIANYRITIYKSYMNLLIVSFKIRL